jgi:glutamate/tyrosine decarboxylase-like PLP-dependent enzyme
MRNDHLTGKYLRINEIPQEGYLEKGKELTDLILADTNVAATDSLANYRAESTAKPGTNLDEIAFECRNIAEMVSNSNAIDREMFRGSANREKDVIAMVSRLFGKTADDDLSAGYLLSGGTESLNQVMYMLRNKFYLKNHGVNVRTKGIGKANHKIVMTKFKRTGQLKEFNPRILLPVNYHFCGVKGTDLLGLGTESLAYYGLDKDFDIDENSLRTVIEKIYREGNDLICSLSVAGDTMHGKVHNLNLLSNVLQETAKKYRKTDVPIIVDAAGSYMFIGVMKDNPNYDGYMPEISFQNPLLEAIVGDPHKQPLPYSCGLLMLKDMGLANYADVRNIISGNYLDMDEESKDITAALATIPTSRSGSNAFAIWGYLVNQGISGLRKEKERIWGLVKEFRDYINESKHYQLVCEPQTQVVSFQFNGNGEDNKTIYKNIKNHEGDFCYISHDTNLLVRTPQELRAAGDTDKYTGLFATIMEHNTSEHLDKLKQRLEEEAEKIGVCPKC